MKCAKSHEYVKAHDFHVLLEVGQLPYAAVALCYPICKLWVNFTDFTAQAHAVGKEEKQKFTLHCFIL